MRLTDPEPYRELPELVSDSELVAAIREVVSAQRTASLSNLDTFYQPEPSAAELTSPSALEMILASGRDINGIRDERGLSNVVVFNDARYENALFSDEITHSRARLNTLMRPRVQALFDEGSRLDVYSSGFFLYPPGAYMGWHTNAGNPGWRLYVTVVDEPGRSFFRYRDPRTGEVITGMDNAEITIRLFRAAARPPVWHTVFSDTNRYSLGFKLDRLGHPLRRLAGRGLRALGLRR